MTYLTHNKVICLFKVEPEPGELSHFNHNLCFSSDSSDFRKAIECAGTKNKDYMSCSKTEYKDQENKPIMKRSNYHVKYHNSDRLFRLFN